VDPLDLGPYDMKELADPAFQDWVKTRDGWPVTPEKQDIDTSTPADSDAEAAHQYRLAQARKVVRLFREWKAQQN
jgi:hypothetical protein